MKFTKIEGGYEVSAETATDNDIIIPAVYEGESVIKIANDGFRSKSNIVSIKIPDMATSTFSH
ncbi:MAG: hypothetical protein LBP62_02545 [Clostridiales bacterium]|nr:hypothetical protein [Clostridiales bacterium]